MKYCQSCILPDTRPGIVLDEQGICKACHNSQRKEDTINWQERESDFEKVLEHAKLRSQGYDCLIPVSGGKDSTWQVVRCLEYGLNPLAVTWRTPSRTSIGQRNLDNLISLGVDHIDYSINPKVERTFMLKAFKRFGATAVPMHMALFYIPLNIAYKLNIPLIVYGENSAYEYGSKDDSVTGFQLNSAWLKQFGVTHGTTAKDWIDEELTEKELTPYFGPSDEDLNQKDIKAIFLGHYFQWDPVESLRVAKANGFEVSDTPKTGYYNYADIDDDFISIHHYLKWFKFGITRTWDNLSLEIRNGRITREEAIAILQKMGDETPKEDISKFCHFVGITHDQFYEIVEQFRNHSIWEKKNDTWQIKNFLIPTWAWQEQGAKYEAV